MCLSSRRARTDGSQRHTWCCHSGVFSRSSGFSPWPLRIRLRNVGDHIVDREASGMQRQTALAFLRSTAGTPARDRLLQLAVQGFCDGPQLRLPQRAFVTRRCGQQRGEGCMDYGVLSASVREPRNTHCGWWPRVWCLAWRRTFGIGAFSEPMTAACRCPAAGPGSCCSLSAEVGRIGGTDVNGHACDEGR